MTLKQETIEEINDLLDDLSPAFCIKTFNKLTLIELLDLKNAIQSSLKNCKAKAEYECL